MHVERKEKAKLQGKRYLFKAEWINEKERKINWKIRRKKERKKERKDN